MDKKLPHFSLDPSLDAAQLLKSPRSVLALSLLLVTAAACGGESYANMNVPALEGGITGIVRGQPVLDVNGYELIIGKGKSFVNKHGNQANTKTIEKPSIGNGYIGKTMSELDSGEVVYSYIPIANKATGRVQEEIVSWYLIAPNGTSQEELERVIGSGYAGVRIEVTDLLASGSSGVFPFNTGGRLQAKINSNREVVGISIGNGNPTQHSIEIDMTSGKPGDYVIMYPQDQTKVAQIYPATPTATAVVPTDVPTAVPTGVPLVTFPDVNVEIKPAVTVESDLALGLAGVALTVCFIASSVAYLLRKAKNNAVQSRKAAHGRNAQLSNSLADTEDELAKTKEKLDIERTRYRDANVFRRSVINLIRRKAPNSGPRAIAPPQSQEPSEFP